MGVDTTVYDLPEPERGLAAIAAQAAQWRREADTTDDQWARKVLADKCDTAGVLIAAGLRAVYPLRGDDYIAERAEALNEATTLFTLTWIGKDGQQTRTGDRHRIEMFARLVKGAVGRGNARGPQVVDARGEDVTTEFFAEVAA
jgi:hypothetical protein